MQKHLKGEVKLKSLNEDLKLQTYKDLTNPLNTKAAQPAVCENDDKR